MAERGSATLLVAKNSAGVTPDVNLRNPLHAGDGSMKVREFSLALKLTADLTKSPK